MNLLERLTYHHGLLRLARLSHLHKLGRTAYWLYRRPPDGYLRLAFGNIETLFIVRTSNDLRLVERLVLNEKRSIEAILSLIKAGDVIYDVGSNCGIYAIPLAKAAGPKGTVVAFEPVSNNYSRLVSNIKANGLSNVVAVRAALGDRPSAQPIYTAGGEGIDTGASLAHHAGSKHELVEVFDGDSYRNRVGLPVPRIIKIDVEGFEYNVICGLRSTLRHPTCELLFCELHPHLLPPGVSVKGIMSGLADLGFARVSGELDCDDRPFRVSFRKAASPRVFAVTTQ